MNTSPAEHDALSTNAVVSTITAKAMDSRTMVFASVDRCDIEEVHAINIFSHTWTLFDLHGIDLLIRTVSMTSVASCAIVHQKAGAERRNYFLYKTARSVLLHTYRCRMKFQTDLGNTQKQRTATFSYEVQISWAKLLCKSSRNEERSDARAPSHQHPRMIQETVS